jgi:hypothetical protein
VTLRATAGRTVAESVEDLQEWLGRLEGCPPVQRTQVAQCTRPMHQDEPGTWFYVEADRVEGVARLRCLACGDTRSLFDSAERWTYPSAWSCSTCRQSIAEVAYGLHVDSGDAVTWVAVATRCVECGDMNGVADFVLPGLPVADVLASL